MKVNHTKVTSLTSSISVWLDDKIMYLQIYIFFLSVNKYIDKK